MYKVAIVGLGAIAGGYGRPDDAAPYVHAGGIMQSDKVALAGACDLSLEATTKFKDKWGDCFPETYYFEDFQAMLDAETWDIVSICIRGPHHYQALLDTIKAGPKAIFLEKPPTCSLAEMDEVVEKSKAADIPITVSYSRHWGAHILRMAELVKDGLIGEVKSVVGHCGQGFLSFASHTTDMICQFAGYCPTAVYANGTIPDEEVPEGYEPEPILRNMSIEFENGVSGAQIGFRGQSWLFYCEVTGTEGIAVVPFYGEAKAFDNDKNEIDLAEYGLPLAQVSPFKLAYDQIAGALNGGSDADCTDEDFIAVNEIGFAGIESVLTKQRIDIPNTNRKRKIFANG